MTAIARDMSELTRLLKSLKKHGATETFRLAPGYVINKLLCGYNRTIRSRYLPPTDLDSYHEIQNRSQIPTDISDHLKRIFIESVQADPDTIVELGVRNGESTFSFERAAELTGADIVSVDIEDCINVTEYKKQYFVQSDDIEFAEEFEGWCKMRDIDTTIDVLFVDTSHLYEHTVEEIKRWFPHLADDVVILFHDTNMSRIYRREDGSVGRGWDNDRGVIRALERYFDCTFDETERFTTVKSGFVIEHYPLCSGLTILRRVEYLQSE